LSAKLQADDTPTRLEIIGDDQAIWHQSAQSNGYAYELTATVSAKGDTMSIRYQLQNTGSKTIETWPYRHNFTTLGGDSTAGIVVAFPEAWQFSPNPLTESQQALTPCFLLFQLQVRAHT